MSTYIFISGKDPELSQAELEVRYTSGGRCANNVKNLTLMRQYLLVDLKNPLSQKEFDTLGGQIKAGKVFGESDRKCLVSALADHLAEGHGSGKLNYGISIYGWPEKNLRPVLLDLKKEFKKRGISSRFANRGFKNISAAQYKGLKDGKEILVCRDSDKFLLAEVVAVQDIDAYSKRDYQKPFRDMKVGMLPPKLAQILINLAGVKGKIWDPFCGGGVLIMEGLLAGHDMLGSDIDEKTLEGAKRNVEWVKAEFGAKAKAELFTHDATQALKGKTFDAIACEGYLGPPQSRMKPEKEFAPVIRELTELYCDFFKALGKFKAPVVIALPFYRTREGELHLDQAVREIQKLGFRKELNLKYARADQLVGRDIFRFSAA
jgi:hypothetical protein